MKTPARAILSCLFFVLPVWSADDLQSLVAPNRYTTSAAEGSQAPFHAPGVRWQNVYTASEFIDAMPEGGIISSIAFRIDESDRSSFTPVIPDIEVRMSTWPGPGLSEVFAENVGSDETVAFPRDRIQLLVRPSPSGPNPFSLRFPLKTPFYYDPRAGGLTVDLFVYANASGRVLVDTGGFETVARTGPIEVERWPIANNGLVLQLEFTAVPEPTSRAIWLCGIGACVLSGSSRGRRLAFSHWPNKSLFLTLCLVASVAYGNDAIQTLVAPNRYEGTVSDASSLPFHGSGVRWQNVYTASEFISAMPEGGIISSIAFRIDESNRSSFTTVIPDIEVRLSTWPSSNLSEVFAENVGGDETVVVPRGSIQFLVRPAVSGPNPFSLRIPLETPFYYDPRAGGLTVDLFVYEGADRGLLVDSGGFETVARTGPIGASSWPIANNGLVLQVEFTAVPEPTAICVFGICAWLLSRSREGRRRVIWQARNKAFILSLCLLVSVARANDAVQTLVAPNRYEGTISDASSLPFRASGIRYQNVYTASEFVETMPEGGVISAVAFRLDESDRNSFTTVIPSIEIRLSTWPSLRLSEVFAENVGPDETVVFPQGRAEFVVRPSASGPNPFSLRFPLDTPFYYDPRAGGLTVDLFIYERATGGVLVDSGGFETAAREGPIGASRWPISNSGLVLQLEYTAVPEPAAIWLFSILAVTVAWRKVI